MQTRSGPRKVIVGTTMFNMFADYPGLEARLADLAGLIDQMAAQAAERYSGARLDLAALPEYAVNGGLKGPAAEIALPLKGRVQEVIGERARAHSCYVVLPLVLAEDPAAGVYTNAAGLLDRRGEVVGIYRKVHLVPGPGPDELEGGLVGGQDFPVFACDFGRIGIQICYDMAFHEGWEVLDRKGAEIVVWPSQWAGQINPAARALRHGYFVLSSTWNNNACLVDPTGHVIREIREDGVLVEQIDLDHVLLHWQAALKEGKAFDEAYGARAGYRYDPNENTGIFWSNDPATPIREMVRALGLEPWPEQIARSRAVQDRLRGGPPRLD